jgi:thiol-disulfide isomerase/thioredoxin
MNLVGAGLLAVVLVAAVAFALVRRRTDGRLAAGPAGAPAAELTAEQLGEPLGERATFVQFSSAFCQPCRATRQVLDEVSGMVDGVGHVEVDAEQRLDLVRRLDVVRTPTVLVLDPDGRVVRRATGQPRKADLIAALGEVIPG